MINGTFIIENDTITTMQAGEIIVLGGIFEINSQPLFYVMTLHLKVNLGKKHIAEITYANNFNMLKLPR